MGGFFCSFFEVALLNSFHPDRIKAFKASFGFKCNRVILFDWSHQSITVNKYAFAILRILDKPKSFRCIEEGDFALSDRTHLQGWILTLCSDDNVFLFDISFFWLDPEGQRKYFRFHLHKPSCLPTNRLLLHWPSDLLYAALSLSSFEASFFPFLSC